MRAICKALFVVALISVIGLMNLLPATSSVISYSGSVPVTTTDWGYTLDLPRFNPALGQLDSVQFALSAKVVGDVMFESFDSSATTITSNLAAHITLAQPDNSLLVESIPTAQNTDDLTSADGIMDFSGTSGRTYRNLESENTQYSAVFTDSDMNSFVGTGSIALPVNAVGKSSATGSGNLAAVFITKASATVTVIYNYTSLLCSVGDTVWVDSDADGVFEPEVGELPLPGVKVYLGIDKNGDGAVDEYVPTVTNAQGHYLFENLNPGKYSIIVNKCTIPRWFKQVYDPDGRLDSSSIVTLASGESNLDQDFGYRPMCPPGTGTPGFWKNHCEAWPVDSITIGGVTYTKKQAICILRACDGGNKVNTMFRALVCAMLNVGIGNNHSCVDADILAANEWMSIYGPVGKYVPSRSEAWKWGEPLYLKLDAYNNGKLCARHRN